MHGTIELIWNSILLYILLETLWSVLVSMLYEFMLPWIFWATITILLGLRIARIPPPCIKLVEETIGLNPLLLNKDDNSCGNHNKEEHQYCMRVVAHRAGGYDYPENSIPAVKNCKDKGCTAIEIDLRLTKDNVPIVFHDTKVDRLTGKAGIIADMTWKELHQLDITLNHPLRDKFVDLVGIASLNDVIEQVLNHDLRIIIDIKENRFDIVQIILDTFEKYPKLYDRALVSSFNPIIIYMIRRKQSRILSCLAWRPYAFSRESFSALDGPGPARTSNPFKHFAFCILDSLYEWALPRFIYYVTGISAIVLHKDTLNQKIVQQWHKRGIRVFAYPVNLPSEKVHFTKHLKVTYLTDTLLSEKVA